MEPERIWHQDHVGKKIIRVSFHYGCDPMINVIVEPNEDENELVAQLSTAIQQAIDGVFSKWSWTAEPGKCGVLASWVVEPAGIEKARHDEQHKELAAIFQKSNAARIKRLQENPDNGKEGYWQVDGIRHDAIVRASSALEAVNKAEASGHVGSWESADANFIGAEMPEVV